MGNTSSQPSDAEDALEPSTTMRRAKLAFPLTEIWTERQWNALYSRCQISLYEVIRSLGILPSDKECRVGKGLWRFGDPILDALSIAVTAVSKEVAERFRGENVAKDVVAAAANPNYLDDQIDELLERFGGEVWGIDVEAREGCKVRLVYEEDNDRQLWNGIYLHLSQWIFLKVFNILRDREKKSKPRNKKRKKGRQGAAPSKKVKVKSAAFRPSEEEADLEEENTFANVVMNGDGTVPVPSRTTLNDASNNPSMPSDRDLLLLGVQMTSGVRSMDPPTNDLDPSQTLLDEPANLTNTPMDNLSSPDSNIFEQRSSSPTQDTPCHSGNLGILLKEHFLRSHQGQLDETTLLSHLSHTWTTQPTAFYKKSSHRSPFGSVLRAWIDWRRNVIRIKGYSTSLPSDPKQEWVYRAGLCKEIRELRKKFMEMRVEVNGKEMESRNVLCVMLGNLMGLDAGKDMEAVKVLRENVCRVDPEVEDLERKGLGGKVMG